MNPQSKSRALNKRALFFLCFCLISICLMKFIPAASNAQTEERELEDRIPKHLPIKVKLKAEKERAFKDMKNEKWVRDFELEVTNTGEKPIYFLDLLVLLPEITAPDGHHIAFSLYYGRTDLIDLQAKLEEGDVPLKPGETHLFSLAEKQQAWELFRKNEHLSQPKKIILHFRSLNFGDGTGFSGNSASPVPSSLTTSKSATSSINLIDNALV